MARQLGGFKREPNISSYVYTAQNLREGIANASAELRDELKLADTFGHSDPSRARHLMRELREMRQLQASLRRQQ